MNLENNPERASQLCTEAQARLLNSVVAVTDDDVRMPSQLPDWTIGHVLTHLARNAEAHARRLEGALRGEDVPKYERGAEQRGGEIEAGAGRSAREIIADLESSFSHLEQVFSTCSRAGWPNGHFLGGGSYGVAACPAHRLREVEMHHADLGRGYTPADWPDEYVAWDLQVLLATVPERLGSGHERRRLMAWLAGRGALDTMPVLDPW